MYGNERWEESAPKQPTTTPELEITIKVKGVATIKPHEVIQPKEGYAADGSVLSQWQR